MIEYLVGQVLKTITYHHLLLKVYTCGTIWGCATIKSNHKNKVMCTQIVIHYATIQWFATNWVNMVFCLIKILNLALFFLSTCQCFHILQW